ncbi:MAG: gluconate kinase, partial [Burkholderiales bacterium PBB5]
MNAAATPEALAAMAIDPHASLAPPPCLVVMGVSGCGKTSVGRRLAQQLGLAFV